MTPLDRYATVLRGTGAAAPLAASVIGRLPLGMTGLAILLLVRESSGSYAAAGLVSAAYAVGFAAISPARARNADRRGPIPILLLMGVLHPLALGALVLLTDRGIGAGLLALSAVLAGATVPPLSAVVRAMWHGLVPASALTTAYAMESVVVELCFVGGPLLVAGLTAWSGPSAAVLAAAVLTLVGTVCFVVTPALRAVTPALETPQHLLGPLVAAPVRGLLVGVCAVGAGFGAIEVALPAFVEEAGRRPGLAGVLLAVWSVGSIVGGLAYGAAALPTPHRRQLPRLAALLGVGTVLPLVVADLVPAGLALMGLALLGYGLAIAPFFTCNSVLLGAAAPPGTVTEAFAWNSSMIFGGAALGTAAAGLLVERAGVPAAFAVAAAAGLVALLASLRAVRRLPVAASA